MTVVAFSVNRLPLQLRLFGLLSLLLSFIHLATLFSSVRKVNVCSVQNALTFPLLPLLLSTWVTLDRLANKSRVPSALFLSFSAFDIAAVLVSFRFLSFRCLSYSLLLLLCYLCLTSLLSLFLLGVFVSAAVCTLRVKRKRPKC